MSSFRHAKIYKKLSKIPQKTAKGDGWAPSCISFAQDTVDEESPLPLRLFGYGQPLPLTAQNIYSNFVCTQEKTAAKADNLLIQRFGSSTYSFSVLVQGPILSTVTLLILCTSMEEGSMYRFKRRLKTLVTLHFVQ